MKITMKNEKPFAPMYLIDEFKKADAKASILGIGIRENSLIPRDKVFLVSTGMTPQVISIINIGPSAFSDKEILEDVFKRFKCKLKKLFWVPRQQ